MEYFCWTGAYSDSRGVPGVRQEVADFILERDGHPRYTYICCSHRFIVVGLWSLSPEMLASILTLISWVISYNTYSGDSFSHVNTVAHAYTIWNSVICVAVTQKQFFLLMEPARVCSRCSMRWSATRKMGWFYWLFSHSSGFLDMPVSLCMPLECCHSFEVIDIWAC